MSHDLLTPEVTLLNPWWTASGYYFTDALFWCCSIIYKMDGWGSFTTLWHKLVHNKLKAKSVICRNNAAQCNVNISQVYIMVQCFCSVWPLLQYHCKSGSHIELSKHLWSSLQLYHLLKLWIVPAQWRCELTPNSQWTHRNVSPWG